VVETNCRCDARAIGVVQVTRRVSADCENNGNLCKDVLCRWSTYAFKSNIHEFCRLTSSNLVAGIKSEDAVFVLSYSVIMLNTDLHNPQNRVGYVS
jgi:hypothetical protein